MTVGILYAFLSAILLGLYALPSKFTKGFAWENTWGGFFFFGMFVIPIILTFSLVDNLWGIYAQSPGWVFPVMFALSFAGELAICCGGTAYHRLEWPWHLVYF